MPTSSIIFFLIGKTKSIYKKEMPKQRSKVYEKYTSAVKRLNQVGKGENKKHHLSSLRTYPIDKAKKRHRTHIYRHPRPNQDHKLQTKEFFIIWTKSSALSKASMFLPSKQFKRYIMGQFHYYKRIYKEFIPWKKRLGSSHCWPNPSGVHTECQLS